MSDPVDRLLEDFAEVTGSARVEQPPLGKSRRPRLGTALAASAVVLVLAAVAFVVLKSPSPGPGPVGQTSPSSSLIASHDVLSVENRGGPTLIVAIDGNIVATVKCNGGTEIAPGNGGVADLPWDLTITNSNDGATLWSERIDGLPRWYLQIGESAVGLSDNPFAGPPGPSCRSARPTASPPTPDPSVEWQEPAAYSFTLDSHCGERALIGRYHIEVEAGTVVTVVPEGSGDDPISPIGVPTLGDLLDIAADARSRNADEVTVVLDPVDGRPVSVTVDWIADAIDDEECYVITDYVPEPSPSPSPSPSPIDEQAARSLAAAYFTNPDTHGSGSQVSNVTIGSAELGTDTTTGRPAWTVQISGDVTQSGSTKPTYVSAMVLSIDAETGEVRIVAEG